MTFKEQGYEIIKGGISKEIAELCYKYLIENSKVCEILLRSKYISPNSRLFGELGDGQVPDAYATYGNVLMEVLLVDLKPMVEKVLEKKIIENYAYARVYYKGNKLNRHKDRFSCQFSTTLHLGGGDWPIYLEPDKTKGGFNNKNKYIPGDTKGVKVDLEPGDMLVYKGNICEHWRDELQNENCAQAFFHYTEVDHPSAEKNRFDGRPNLGLPSYFSKHIIEGTEVK